MPSLRGAPPDHSSTHDDVDNNDNDNKSAAVVEVDQRNPVRSQGAAAILLKNLKIVVLSKCPLLI